MIDFSRIGLVVRREWLTRIRQRSYQITTLVQILFVIAAAASPVIISMISDDTGSGTANVLVLDQTGGGMIAQLVPYVDANGEAGGEAIVLHPTELSEEEARARIDAGDADAALIVTRDDANRLAFTYVSESGESSGISQQIQAAAAAVTMRDQLAQQGIDPATFEAAAAPPAFALERAEGGTANGEDDFSGPEIALAYFFTIVMFMAIMLYGTWVAQGVVEEKSSRIMEIMINAATPRDLLAGKVLGIGAAGLTQLLPMLLAGGLVFGLQRPIARALDVDTSELPNLDFGAVSLSAIGWFLAYFLLGFTLYAALYAGLGSLVSRQEEVNQAVSPLMTVMMVGYFAAFFTMFMPDSMLSRVLSIFPLTAPFIMVSRTIMSEVPAWELGLSVLLLAVSMVLAIWVAGRIYRMGVLQYGQKPSLRAVFSQNLTTTAR